MKSRVSRFGSRQLLLSAFSSLLLLTGCTRFCMQPFLGANQPQNRTTPNRAQAAISAQDAQRGVRSAPRAPRGSQAVAISLQGCAEKRGHASVNPDSAFSGFWPQQTPEVAS